MKDHAATMKIYPVEIVNKLATHTNHLSLIIRCGMPKIYIFIDEYLLKSSQR